MEPPLGFLADPPGAALGGAHRPTGASVRSSVPTVQMSCQRVPRKVSHQNACPVFFCWILVIEFILLSGSLLITLSDLKGHDLLKHSSHYPVESPPLALFSLYVFLFYLLVSCVLFSPWRSWACRVYEEVSSRGKWWHRPTSLLPKPNSRTTSCQPSKWTNHTKVIGLRWGQVSQENL